MASLSWRPFLFSLSGSHLLSTEVMILASANAAISPGGMARGGWRTGRRRKERVSPCGSVWGRIAPPPDEEFVGGGCSFGPSNTSALARVTATTTLAEARADVGSRLLAWRRRRRWRRRARTSALLDLMTATKTLAEARADAGSRLLARRRRRRWRRRARKSALARVTAR